MVPFGAVTLASRTFCPGLSVRAGEVAPDDTVVKAPPLARTWMVAPAWAAVGVSVVAVTLPSTVTW